MDAHRMAVAARAFGDRYRNWRDELRTAAHSAIEVVA